ncbi:hypothetical protein QBC35DRAFT_546627 [Podospora australis]|uniref:Thioredoxin domain-containing protein n=1 Tax=Podospora australis TaxID=1536484 RepID=A0AAN6WIB2_9PEZI|nr:hypothetical protein QBC35DRAFT_546627 [Podospora australis]
MRFKTMKLCLAWTLSLLPVALAERHTHIEASESSIKVLFEEVKQDWKLVAFVLPKEENSQALGKEWKTLLKNEKRINLSSLDCSANVTLCKQTFDVHSFPTIRLFEPSSRTSYRRFRGPKTAEAIADFYWRSIRPAVALVNEQNITEFQTGNNVAVVMHFGSAAPLREELRQEFISLANSYYGRSPITGVSFGIAEYADAEGKDKLEIECVNNFEDIRRSIGASEMLKGSTIEMLKRFVDECTAPLIPELTIRNELVFYQTGKSIVRYFVPPSDERKAYVKEMRLLAKKYQEYLHFVTVDAHKYSDGARAMGLTEGVTGLVVQQTSNGAVYPYRRNIPISAASVESFLVDIIQGREKPWNPQEQTGKEAHGHDEL